MPTICKVEFGLPARQGWPPVALVLLAKIALQARAMAALLKVFLALNIASIGASVSANTVPLMSLGSGCGVELVMSTILRLTWWLAAGALFLAGAHAWTKPGAHIEFDYPGALYPIACWTLLVAAVATPLADGVALLALRPRDWRRWLWFRNSVTLIVYAALIATLWEWRLLGFG